MLGCGNASVEIMFCSGVLKQVKMGKILYLVSLSQKNWNRKEDVKRHRQVPSLKIILTKLSGENTYFKSKVILATAH